MRKIFTEAISVNLVLVLMLVSLAGLSLFNGKAISTFAVKGPVYKCETTEKTVSLMVNVYENSEIVKKMADMFFDYGIKATFFVGGCWANKNVETVRYLSDKGFEIGNHGYNHKSHTKLSKEENISEISRTNSLIKEATGVKCRLFAPPSGDVNELVTECAEQCGCETIMWSCDTIDWRDEDIDKIVSRVKRNLQPGAFILIHPKEHTVEALKEIIPYIRENGYSFITVGEALKINICEQ